ncbi:WYL domain-containing protein [Arvimicrobium flavum]|uniref:WYL domain-containing protein n=1 Tax=Arvimicrobium flavum TaxID=3393320 RepID=UPI00237B8653|nr:WYL domain-containing protein [Mesorhizobium shangrilense]
MASGIQLTPEEERDLIESTERGEWRSLGNLDQRKAFWRNSVERTEHERQRETGARDNLLRAIRERRRVLFEYRNSQRAVDPYILGFDPAGRLILSAFQRSGGTGTGFRAYLLGGMSNLTITDQPFDIEPDYNPADPNFDELFGRVEEVIAQLAA